MILATHGASQKGRGVTPMHGSIFIFFFFMGACARVVWVRGALGPCRCVVWRSSVLGARCGRGLSVKEPGLFALWQGDQCCGRSVGSWMDCGDCQGWSGTRVLGINRGSRHSTFSGRAHWSNHHKTHIFVTVIFYLPFECTKSFNTTRGD